LVKDERMKKTQEREKEGRVVVQLSEQMNLCGDSKKIMIYLQELYKESMDYERESKSRQYKKKSDNMIKDFIELLRFKENTIIKSISELEVLKLKHPVTFEKELEKRKAVNKMVNAELTREKERKSKNYFF
jgi:hypothetical protein